MIYEILPSGVNNAVSGKHIANSLNIELRDVTKLIERERQKGVPICAAVAGNDRGYYIAENAGELALYLKSLDRRIKNVNKTRRALEATLTQMTGQTEIDGW